MIDEVIATEVGLLYVAALDDADVKLVHVRSQSLVDAFLQLGDVLLTSEFPDDGETDVLDVEDGVVDAFDVVL